VRSASRTPPQAFECHRGVTRRERQSADGSPRGRHVIHCAATQRHRAATQRHCSATQLHRAATQRHCSATRLHRAATQRHCSATRLHRAATQRHCSATQLHRAATQRHCSATQLHRATTQRHRAATRLHRAAILRAHRCADPVVRWPRKSRRPCRGFFDPTIVKDGGARPRRFLCNLLANAATDQAS
jgi:hypothetical protein